MTLSYPILPYPAFPSMFSIATYFVLPCYAMFFPHSPSPAVSFPSSLFKPALPHTGPPFLAQPTVPCQDSFLPYIGLPCLALLCLTLSFPAVVYLASIRAPSSLSCSLIPYVALSHPTLLFILYPSLPLQSNNNRALHFYTLISPALIYLKLPYLTLSCLSMSFPLPSLASLPPHTSSKATLRKIHKNKRKKTPKPLSSSTLLPHSPHPLLQ